MKIMEKGAAAIDVEDPFLLEKASKAKHWHVEAGNGLLYKTKGGTKGLKQGKQELLKDLQTNAMNNRPTTEHMAHGPLSMRRGSLASISSMDSTGSSTGTRSVDPPSSRTSMGTQESGKLEPSERPWSAKMDFTKT